MPKPAQPVGRRAIRRRRTDDAYGSFVRAFVLRRQSRLRASGRLQILRSLDQAEAARVRRSIAIAGWLAASGYTVQTILSFWLAQGPPSVAATAAQTPFYRSLTGLAPLPFLHGDGTFLLLLCAPLAAVTLACALLLARLYAGPDIDELSLDRLSRWALVFAAINVFALPVVAQDFWSSLAWGTTSPGTSGSVSVGERPGPKA